MAELLAPGLWWLHGTRGSNVYLVEADDGRLALVDTGFGSSAEAILEEVRAHGGHLAAILLTHLHTDHSGSAAAVRRATGAQVVAGRGDCFERDGRLFLRSSVGRTHVARFIVAVARRRRTRLTPVDVAMIEEQEVLPGIRAVPVPGHTPGSVCYVVDRIGAAFVGDMVISHHGRLTRSMRMANHDDEGYLESLRRFAEVAPEAGLPGHGTPVLHGFGDSLGRISKMPRTSPGVRRVHDRALRLWRFSRQLSRKRTRPAAAGVGDGFAGAAASRKVARMKPYVLVIGHAAAAGEAPPNTLAGVRACLDCGAEAMEIDVQLCADGVPVLMHDDTVDRTTNLTGPVREKTLAELQAADAGNGEPVPTLDQVLALAAGKLTVMCELKATPGSPEQDQACVDAVVEVIRKHEAESWTAIHSFNPDMVERARRTEPRVSGTIITVPVFGEDVDRLLGGLMKRNGQAISVEHHAVDRALVEKAKRRQVSVWTWTPDETEDWARVVNAGVDGIITNFPHRLRAWLDRPGS